MPDLTAATEMTDRIDTEKRLPQIEEVALDQLAKTRVKVDRYSLPKYAEGMMPGE